MIIGFQGALQGREGIQMCTKPLCTRDSDEGEVDKGGVYGEFKAEGWPSLDLVVFVIYQFLLPFFL